MTLRDTEDAVEETILAAEARVADPPIMAPNKFLGGLTYHDTETPQEAAERIWTESVPIKVGTRRERSYGHNPIETMRRFDEWARVSPERMLVVITEVIWHRAVRAFLERKPKSGGWCHSPSFKKAMWYLEKKISEDGSNAIQKRERRGQWDREPDIQGLTYCAKTNRRARDRVFRGVKVVQAEVDISTGAVVNLIDKEYGPFAHIRIRTDDKQFRLPDVTTEAALAWCDETSADVRFIRALCYLIPDPRKPIGEQWTAEMIREAKDSAW